jgi:hypothetical protein
MKLLSSAMIAGIMALSGSSVAIAQSLPEDASAQVAPASLAQPPKMSENEEAGLPDLATINRPAAESTATIDLNTPRTPSYHAVSGSGTEITEFRDRGKPVEIDVRSSFGTRYHMSPPIDASPTVRSNGQVSTRLPSIGISY